MAGHHVPAEAIAGAQGAFEIDGGTNRQSPERGQRQGFVGNVGRKGFGIEGDDGEANARHRDAFAQGNIAAIEVGKGNVQTQIAAARLLRNDAAYSLNQSGKHQGVFSVTGPSSKRRSGPIWRDSSRARFKRSAIVAGWMPVSRGWP